MKYSAAIRALHWIVAIIVIALLVTAENQWLLPKVIRKEYYFIHKSLGAIVLGLMVMRFFIRQASYVPPYPDTMKKIEKVAAKSAVFAFYLLLIAMPLSGWVMSNSAGYPVSVFGFFDLPMIVEKNKEIKHLAKDAHEIISNGIILLLAVHVLAVIKHRLVEKENLMKRMW